MSRLIKNSEELRDNLKGRNLYQPEDPYNIDPNKVTSTLSSILNALSPFKAYNLDNSSIIKLIDPNSQLAKLSVQYLGIQLARSASANANREYLPSFNPENLIDGNPKTKLFTNKKDFEITNATTISSSGVDKIKDILGNIAGTNFQSNPFGTNSIMLYDGSDKSKSGLNKFTSSKSYSTSNSFYIKNTGKGQIESLLKNIRLIDFNLLIKIIFMEQLLINILI